MPLLCGGCVSARAMPGPFASGVVLMGGSSTSWPVLSLGLSVRRACSVGTSSLGVGGLGTLLGPEGTGAGPGVGLRICPWVCLLLLVDRPGRHTAWFSPRSGVGVWVWGSARCLRTAQWTRASLTGDRMACPFYWGVGGVVISVVKFLRAHGGCLGTRSR